MTHDFIVLETEPQIFAVARISQVCGTAAGTRKESFCVKDGVDCHIYDDIVTLVRQGIPEVFVSSINNFYAALLISPTIRTKASVYISPP